MNIVWVIEGRNTGRYNLGVAIYFIIVYDELGDLCDLNTLIIPE